MGGAARWVPKVQAAESWFKAILATAGLESASEPLARWRRSAEPHTGWVRHALRINELIDNQVRSLRKRQVVGSYKSGDRKGTYWGIRSDIADYPAANTLPFPPEQTALLAEYPTRLAHAGT